MLLDIPETHLSVDHASQTIILERIFKASRDAVFEAWTRAEHVACWWDPTGEPLDECEIDLRKGGVFRFVPHASKHVFAGVYREIVRPEKLVFEAMGSTGRVLLSERDGVTHMKVSIECGSALQLTQFIEMGVAVGTARTLDNLVDYLGPRGGR